MKLSPLQYLYICIFRHIKITLKGMGKSCQIIFQYLEFIFFVYEISFNICYLDLVVVISTIVRGTLEYNIIIVISIVTCLSCLYIYLVVLVLSSPAGTYGKGQFLNPCRFCTRSRQKNTKIGGIF